MKTLKDIFTMAEAAREYGVSRQWMHELVRVHKLKTIRLHDRCLLISASELRKLPKKKEGNNQE